MIYTNITYLRQSQSSPHFSCPRAPACSPKRTPLRQRWKLRNRRITISPYHHLRFREHAVGFRVTSLKRQGQRRLSVLPQKPCFIKNTSNSWCRHQSGYAQQQCQRIRTPFLASMSAPAAMRAATVSACPLDDAKCNGVFWS